MTDDPTAPPGYEVGYRRPPKHSRFKKGRSGNPKGRPRKRGAVPVDFDAIVNRPVTVVQDGKPRTMPPKEVALRKILKKAIVDGDLNSITYLLDQFDKYGAIDWSTVDCGGVLTLPNTMPWRMAVRMFRCFGKPPWTKRQLDLGRAEYSVSRTDEQRREDELLEYPDL